MNFKKYVLKFAYVLVVLGLLCSSYLCVLMFLEYKFIECFFYYFVVYIFLKLFEELTLMEFRFL